MARTKIEWTESTWNPVTGCTKVSDGCANCYAYIMANRLQKMGNYKYRNGFRLTLHEECLSEPLSWKKPSLIFVNSMSDLFHEEIPVEFVKAVFSVMNKANWHTFQVLTKRAERLSELASELVWTDNIWQGVTVENEKNKFRIDYLRRIPAAVKFISFEPLIGDVGQVNLEGIDWAIVGGESGFNCRPMEVDWVLNIKRQCEEQNVLFYFKQWGGVRRQKNGRLLLGRTWDEMPALKTGN
jgi:protein gp37